MKPVTCRPGGKTKLVKKLVPKIPPHETYVEPFFGTGAIFFNKERVKREIINDIDKELMTLHKKIQRMKTLTCDLKGNREKFNRLVNKKKKTPCETLYVTKNSFGCQGTSFGSKIKGEQNFDKQIERLKGAEIHNEDFRKTLKRTRSKDSFAYLDPPYDEKCNYGKEICDTPVTPEEVAKATKSFPGKTMISYNDTPRVRKAFKGFKVQKVDSRWAINNKISMKKQMKKELVIRNYVCKIDKGRKVCKKI